MAHHFWYICAFISDKLVTDIVGFRIRFSTEFTYHMYLKYRIPSNYRTVRLSISKILGKLVVKYVPTYNKSTLKKSAKDLSNDAYAMFFFFFFFFVFVSDFLHKSIFCGYSFELYQQVDAIQMDTPTLFKIYIVCHSIITTISHIIKLPSGLYGLCIFAWC